MASSFNKIERAHQMYRDGQHEEALGFYTEALLMAKTKAQRIALHSNRAACYLKLHDFSKAAAECTSVLELDHKHTGALMLRAQTLVTLKEYQSALFDVNRLLELNPSSEVYQDLQTRLRTQLSLAPIPESEEEAELEEEEEEEEAAKLAELEEEDEEEEEATVSEVNMGEKTQSITNPETPTPQTQSFDEPSNSKKEPTIKKPETSLPQKEPTLKKPETSPPQKEPTLKKPEPSLPQKEPAIKKPETALPQTRGFKEKSDLHSKGWEAIPKPKGHSNLDYSRWDQVEDDSSGDEDDDDEEEMQPQYRFRVKTVGVRSVK